MLFYCANTLHNNYRQVDCKILCLENQLKKIENVKWNIIQKWTAILSSNAVRFIFSVCIIADYAFRNSIP